jgi:hypothetical protein
LNNFKFVEDGGSQVSLFNLFIDVVSMAIFTFEVILDQLKSDIQAIADAAVSGNNKWVQNQMFLFQYGDVVQLINFVPTYSPVDPTHRLITQCAVKDRGNGIIDVKVAKGSTPPFSPLAAPELAALKDYYFGTATTEGVGFAGVNTNFITLDPDRLWVNGDIYFLGQYVEATVKTEVITAINNFLSSFSGEAFNGRVFMIKLIDAIQQVPGVSRVYLNGIKARAAAIPYSSATSIDIQGFYDTVAGHIISEDESGQTLNDTLTMIQEIS